MHTSSRRPESLTKKVNHWFNSFACDDSFGFKTNIIPFVSSEIAGQHDSYLFLLVVSLKIYKIIADLKFQITLDHH